MSVYDTDMSHSGSEETPGSGGEPETFGKCTECHAIYPVQRTESDGLRPVGTDGSCRCGNGDFQIAFEQ